MKLSHVLNNLLTNKTVLNIVCVLSALNMIGYLVTNNLTAILFFVVLAIMIVQFNKNMIIVLGIPLILVNFFVAMGMSKMIEGNQNMSDTTKNGAKKDGAKKDGAKKDDMKKDDMKKDDMKKDKQADKPAKKTNQDLPMTPLDPVSNTDTDEAFEVGRAKRGGSKIDYASTVEDAYDQLNSILGSEGVKRLTGDTQKLMEQQMQLAESMKGMGPMIKQLEPMMNQAKGLLEGMGDGDGQGMQGIMEMAKKFSGALNKQ
jgi:hypothetical protein